jgi:hypothetical protein
MAEAVVKYLQNQTVIPQLDSWSSTTQSKAESGSRIHCARIF